VAEASHSVAFALHAELVRRGARVRVHDPVLGREAVERLGFEWDDLMSGWAEGAVLQAAHDAYRQIDPQTAVGLRALVDGRGVLDGGAWRRVGVAFAGIGR
jgi:UDP-N-acetyl-D-mannosaminuronate dehydrogenase